MLNSSEREIYIIHRCLNANNCWHFNIYEQDNYKIFLKPEKSLFLGQHFSFYENLKFDAHLSQAWKKFQNLVKLYHLRRRVDNYRNSYSCTPEKDIWDFTLG